MAADAPAEVLQSQHLVDDPLRSKIQSIVTVDPGKAGKRNDVRMNAAAVYQIPATAAEFFKVVHERFRTRLEALPFCITTYYDTFDWRVYRSDAVLQASQDGVHRLLTWTSPDLRLCCRAEGEGMPGFTSEFPDGPLKETLSPVLKMRRLLPIVHVEETGLVLHILGAEEKTVARVRLLDSTVRVPGESKTTELPSMLEIVPIKGYDKARQKLAAFIENELGLSRETDNGLLRAVSAVNIVPGDYTSKFKAHLEPSMSMGQAAIEIYRVLLNSMLINEEGTRADLDSEFLHDFRVAVRRTRSALSQIKKVFPKTAVKHFGKEFAWLGRITGPNRDLDVYLLKMKDYQSLLPRSLRNDLRPLYGFLKRRQLEEHHLLVEALDSERYQRLLRDWPQFLEEQAATESTSAKADEPVGPASSKRIWKVYRRILEKGAAIDDQSPASALHELRIECKKLRYLLEFFRSLYEPGEIRKLVKSLRTLQDNLGDFNDYEVQQVTLKGFAQTMLEEGSGKVETLMAMGQLIERLKLGQQKERQRFSKRFAKFSSEDNKRRFRTLLSAKVSSQK
jgi:CHAD domain-containing protein